MRIADRAFHVLKGEAKLNAELDRQLKSRQGSRSVANFKAESGKMSVGGRHSVKEGTHEGGQADGERTFMAPVPPLEMVEINND